MSPPWSDWATTSSGLLISTNRAARRPPIGTLPICESPKTPAEPPSTRCWAVNLKFDRAIPLMELRHSEVLGRCWQEGRGGSFSSSKAKVSTAQTADDYARLSIPFSTRFRSLKKWTWGEPGVASVHGGVHLAAPDVSVLAAAIRSGPPGRKHLTGAAVVVPGSPCLHLYFIKTDFMTGIFFFFFFFVAPSSDFMGCFTLPSVPHGFILLKTANPTPRKISPGNHCLRH